MELYTIAEIARGPKDTRKHGSDEYENMGT